MSFYRDETRKAGKKYRCNTCHKIIEIGEKYHDKAGNQDGDIWQVKECEKCQRVIDEYLEYAIENNYNDDRIQEWWRDEKCPECKNYWPECKPDGNCENSCGYEENGKCTGGDSCDEMTHYCRCENFKEGV